MKKFLLKPEVYGLQLTRANRRLSEKKLCHADDEEENYYEPGFSILSQ